jgi:formate dehydrogenase alpha subunit
VAGLAAAFGSGAMTNSIADIDKAETIFVIGSNTTETHPIIALQIIKATRNGANLIVADPRRIDLVDYADVWLRHRPGTDIALLNGLMNVIIKENLIDKEFIKERTENFEEVKKTVSKYTPKEVEKITEVPAEDIQKAARLYAKAKYASIFYTMGITQHTKGTDNVLSIANLAMMTGNIGKPGAGVNPLRGQNNVQGACDMGALPNLLPGYQSVTDSRAREKFENAWKVKLPKEPGLTVVEMMNAACDGKIKAMYIMGENPVLTDPDANHVEEALKFLDFLVVQDIFLTETAQLADVVLPGVSFAEKGGTFTSTERRVQRVRKAIAPIENSMSDWRIICELAKALGHEMDYTSPAQIMREIASLVPIYGGITYDRIGKAGLQWPCPTPGHPGTPILHVDKFSRGKGKFHPVEYREAAEQPDKDFPLILTTGRWLYQYHTGSMSRRSSLEEISHHPVVEINQADAKKYNIDDGDDVELISRRGKIKLKACVTNRSSKGTVFVPFHFAESPVNQLTIAALDPTAKIPELKVCAVKIKKTRGQTSS